MDHCEKRQKKRNPRETANILSLLTFAYTESLFQKAYRNDDLEEDDLYEVLEACVSKDCGNKLEEEWILQNKEHSPPSIYRLMWARFGWRYMFVGCINLVWKIFNSIVEPWAFSQLIGFFKPGQMKVTRNDAYGFASVVLGLHLFHTFYIHNYAIWLSQLGIEIKTSLSSLLYRKALKMAPSAISDISLGNIVTLITKDIATFQTSIWILNELWVGCVQTLIVCYLLYAKVGFVSFTGVAILLSVLPLQVYIGKYVGVLRLATGQKTDERLQTMQEILSTIRIIKMYNWEEFFSDKINAARLQEVSKLLLAFYLKVVVILVGMFFSKIGFYILIMSIIWFGYSPDAELVFYILTVFRDLNHTLAIIIPWGIAKSAEVYSSVIRINKVLQAEELPPKHGSDDPTTKPLVELNGVTVNMKETKILRNVSFNTQSGLTLVTGAVGSGKSTLLKTVLQDYPLSSGALVTYGRISYASQEPWLFPSSIKQNILFGQEFNEKRYAEVIRVCALEYDFQFFEKGDETIVSDRGLNLSKGQQARVNLARAVYKESEIYLLDDSLTALDSHVQDHIFTECIQTFLKDKVCILVTQTARQIEKADTVLIMGEGEIKYHGRPNEAVLDKLKELIVEDDDLEKDEESIEKDSEGFTDIQTAHRSRTNVEEESLRGGP
ncbi:hypothetical protein JTB14_029399 [Gonioctena quinquepunctata]|nr:hypothetical protein JTB14_029399 [Gonioctena quinquepunctata]